VHIEKRIEKRDPDPEEVAEEYHDSSNNEAVIE